MKRFPLLIVCSITAVWIAWFGWFTIARHNHLNSSRFDLGNVEQTIWNTVHGRFFTMTNPYGTETVSRLAFHGDLFLVVLTPFYAAFPSPETLILLQVLAVASGGWAAWLIGKKISGSPWWGVLGTAVYFIQPGLQWATIFDVHAVTFATPLILWAVYGAMTKRNILTVAMVVLAMLTKEEIGLSLAGIGLFVWLWQKRRRLGVLLTVGPIVWTLLMFFVFMPLARNTLRTPAPVYDSAFGATAGSIVTNAVRHPGAFARTVLGRTGQAYTWQIGQSYGWTFLASPWTLAAVPDAVINIISAKPAQRLIYSHYTGGITPWMVVGTLSGGWWVIARVRRRWPQASVGRAVMVAVPVWLVLWCTYGAWSLGPLPGTPHDWTRFATWNNEYVSLLQPWREIIRSTDAVSVTNDIGSQFARREKLYSFPLGIDQSEYIVVLEHHAAPVVATDNEVSNAVAALKKNPQWLVLESTKDLTILKRWK